VRTGVLDTCIGAYIKMGYEPRTYVLKDENGDLVVDSHAIFNSGILTSVFVQCLWN
jgi:hypothetical protein